MDSLPPDLAAFIRSDIDSVGELEALLLLHRSKPARWQGAGLAQRLYIREPQAAAILQRLVARRLALPAGDGVTFDGVDGATEARVQELARYYGTHLIQISNIIHAKAPSRIQQFADAFNFKRKK